MFRQLVCATILTCLSIASFASAETPTTLRQAAGNWLIGAAVTSRDIENPQRADLVAEQFNCLTAANEFKVDSLQHVKGTFTFERADKILAFAQQHDMKMVGHNLCWHNQIPKWMFADASGKPLPREEALANLKTHIDTVMTHFKGKVLGWDVVNEVCADGGSDYLRVTPARKAIGDDYIEKAFEFAHAADPDAELYYNDYNIENPGKREKALKLIRDLKSKGLRIDAVGIQGHWMLKQPFPKVIDDAIVAFANAGVKVMFTEVDIEMLPRNQSGADINGMEPNNPNPYPNGLPPELVQAEANRYAELFKVFKKHRDVITRITFWGVDDGSSWLNNWPTVGRTNYPMLWDRQFKPKPAFDAVMKVLASGAK
jgi:endo-1,4-beta-xylanase